MAAFGALFHDDATFVNRFGHYVRRARAWRIQALENVTLTDPRSGRAILRS
jgi:hypothetical protein